MARFHKHVDRYLLYVKLHIVLRYHAKKKMYENRSVIRHFENYIVYLEYTLHYYGIARRHRSRLLKGSSAQLKLQLHIFVHSIKLFVYI